ncbi:hypothetical protein [Pseudoflavitalea rhizosphaerae]|uniref:hypothetical protein n=1 Tax=Pseudoflavitalea rhizosphaerae TaxID=1884793 RepID=UPI000F8C6284|nr:hypothetical protein [Pseudoflavitalea rhizosphaerae]
MYTNLPKLPGIADEAKVEIHYGEKLQRRTIKQYEIKVTGQTSGEWIWLGDTISATGSPLVE